MTPAALACINDREVEKHEREFKSSYPVPATGSSPTTDPTYDPPNSHNRLLAGMGFGGATLLGGVLLLSLVKVIRYR